MSLWYVHLLHYHSHVLPDDNYSFFERVYDSVSVDLVLGKFWVRIVKVLLVPVATTLLLLERKISLSLLVVTSSSLTSTAFTASLTTSTPKFSLLLWEKLLELICLVLRDVLCLIWHAVICLGNIDNLWCWCSASCHVLELCGDRIQLILNVFHVGR